MKERQAKRRNNATRKDEKTKSSTRKDDKLTVLNGVFSRGVYSSFRVGISTFRVAGFVISRGVISSFRLFAWRYFVFSSFRVVSFRLFVFSHGVISGRKDEKTKWHKPATIILPAFMNFCCHFVYMATTLFFIQKF